MSLVFHTGYTEISVLLRLFHDEDCVLRFSTPKAGGRHCKVEHHLVGISQRYSLVIGLNSLLWNATDRSSPTGHSQLNEGREKKKIRLNLKYKWFLDKPHMCF